eukprot:gnl/Dysnectes_brevis/5123_a7228_648.p1 GENE.gnl/Dysnectes_brevis/5123_a7228_648~~gnl/Dysnectes_brevis/5123_a7228_648.p1  ORF type:complete len:239 (-),score=39.69 gnl/Dysnectes_brevis/5123_a7228_648:123-839(-)
MSHRSPASRMSGSASPFSMHELTTRSSRSSQSPMAKVRKSRVLNAKSAALSASEDVKFLENRLARLEMEKTHRESKRRQQQQRDEQTRRAQAERMRKLRDRERRKRESESRTRAAAAIHAEQAASIREAARDAQATLMERKRQHAASVRAERSAHSHTIHRQREETLRRKAELRKRVREEEKRLRQNMHATQVSKRKTMAKETNQIVSQLSKQRAEDLRRASALEARIRALASTMDSK